MPLFAYYRISETGEPGMSVIDAPSIGAAKALAMTAINSGELRAARFWDGHRMTEMRRPDRPANAVSSTRVATADDRGARMIAMKADGMTLKQIAEDFGIGVERVRQLMARVRLRTRMESDEPNRAALSVRAANTVRFLINEPEQDPRKRDALLPNRVAALTRTQILGVSNTGRSTIAEIEVWLWDRGLCFSEGD